MASVLNRRFIPSFSLLARRLGSTFSKTECHEITIPIPWGHTAGKFWGPKDVRPILCLHGWQDNAGSFDRLIPLLPSHLSYLAIDLPGHGLSSHIPDGLSYNIGDFINLINIIKVYYGWDKVSLMGHSMGSKINFIYSCLHSDICDVLVGIDLLKPNIKKLTKTIENMKKSCENTIIYQKRKENKSLPPTYPHDALVKRLVKGTNYSITPDIAHHILDRGSKESQEKPNEFYVSRDNRLKSSGFSDFTHELVLEMAKLSKTPYLFIKATKSPYFEEKKYFDDTLEVLKKNNPRFECLTADGGHHIHLTKPENISNEISNFILKYRTTC